MKSIDMDFLEQRFNVTLNNKDEAIFSMNAIDMLNLDHMDQLLLLYSPLIKAKDPAPAAAYFSKYFSAIALAFQCSLSVENQSPDFSLQNLTVQLYPKENNFAFSFKLNRWSYQDGPSNAGDRNRWLDRAYSDFYGHTVKPLFESASRSALIDMELLWGQLPTYFNRNLDLLTNNELISYKENIYNDYDFLKYQIEPSVFGCVKNPFDTKIKMVEDLRDPNKQIRMKNACCQFYRTGNEQCCYTCPRMDEEYRAARRIEFQKNNIAVR